MFYDPAEFPFTSGLEKSFAAIRREVEALPPNEFKPWPEKMMYENRWDVFVLYNFGRKLEGNCALCPETTRAIENVPGLTTAGFSWMAAGTYIKPHTGYTDTVLRCHLGLIVPPDCALLVGGETRSWQEGKTLIFDDTVVHEAWNRSNSQRVVLLLDFEKRGKRFERGGNAIHSQTFFEPAKTS
jgi:beta-hydroxylase